MRAKLKAAVLLVLLLAVCLTMTGCDDVKEDIVNLFKKPIEFTCGKFHPTTEELSISVSAEEIPLLDGFEALRTVDFTDSRCYEEITAWADANPDVKVLCTVPMPDGSSVQLLTETLDLSGLSNDMLQPMSDAMKLLPRLKEVDLGKPSGTDKDLSFEDLAWLRADNPSLRIISEEYSFQVFGQTVSLNDTELDLSGIGSEDVQRALNLVSMMPMLEFIELGSEGGGLSWDDVLLFQQIFPEIEQHYGFSLYGQSFNIDVETMDFSFRSVEDNGKALEVVLPYLLRCNYVDMDSCGIANERMAELQAQFPNVKLVWRVFFGHAYTLRTDAERLLASKPSAGGNLSQRELADLRYCTDLKYLDIGHNMNVGDLSFLAPLTKLEVVVLAMNCFTDISPLANCPNLEYLELYTTNTVSVEPLRNLTKLKHLNIGETKVTDISPLYGLDLERLWIGAETYVPAEQVAEMRALHPDCVIDTTVTDPSDGAWRYGKTDCWPWVYHERYALLREQMGYDGPEYNFKWRDEKYTEHFG